MNSLLARPLAKCKIHKFVCLFLKIAYFWATDVVLGLFVVFVCFLSFCSHFRHSFPCLVV